MLGVSDMQGFSTPGTPALMVPNTGYSVDSPGLTFYRTDLRRPKVSDFDLQTGSSITTKDGIDRMMMSVTSVVGQLRMMTQPIPAPPYTIDFAGIMAGLPSATDADAFGIVLFDGTKVRGFYPQMTSEKTKLAVDSWTTPTIFSVVVQGVTTLPTVLSFLRITDDGSTRSFYWSYDGKSFAQVFTETTGTFVVPTRVGLGMYHSNGGLSSLNTVGACYHWQVTPSVNTTQIAP